MIDALNKKGYNGFSLAVPSSNELVEIFVLASPVFITMMSKVVWVVVKLSGLLLASYLLYFAV